MRPFGAPTHRGTLGDMHFFHDRADAGRRLVQRLEWLRGRDVVVLGLPRGGVPVVGLGLRQG